MNLHRLKPLRVGIAICFLLPVAFLFLDFRDTGIRYFSREILYLQFVPSLLKFMNKAAPQAGGFILILILTFFFGRVYCSTVCPLGTLQDIISRLTRKKQQSKTRYTDTKPHPVIRYTILFLTLLLFLSGSGLLLNLLDPFSSFGRLLSGLVRPVVIAVNNLSVSMMEQIDSHVLYRVQYPVVIPVALAVSAVTLILIGWLSARHGRLYCNTLCPVGTLLGLVAKISRLRISIDIEACRECGQCVDVCKSGCIDLSNHAIDLSRCVSCFNCLETCRAKAMQFGSQQRKNPNNGPAKAGRRSFMLSLAMGGVGMAMDAAGQTDTVIQSRPTTVPTHITCPISPPGSAGIDQFISRCTACQLCVSICPSRVLVPSFFDYGISGLLQPRMDFIAGHCNYDCTACLDVCPSGAILPMTKEKKQRTQLGVAKFIKENCVVFTDNTNCGACSEHCPTKAVHMIPYPNSVGRKLVIPEMNEEICVGCGGCEHACPTKPYKAIYVDGNPVHRTARKPKENKIEQTVDDTKAFPF